MIKAFEVGIENLGIGLILKPDGLSPAFSGRILPNIEANTDYMEKCQIMLFSKRRNPDGSNDHIETPNAAIIIKNNSGLVSSLRRREASRSSRRSVAKVSLRIVALLVQIESCQTRQFNILVTGKNNRATLGKVR